jgi:hypothetical protein
MSFLTNGRVYEDGESRQFFNWFVVGNIFEYSIMGIILWLVKVTF